MISTTILPDMVLNKATGSQPTSTETQTPRAHNKTQLIPITVPMNRGFWNQGAIFDVWINIVFAKMSNASNVMPVQQAHLETAVRAKEIGQIFFIVQYGCGMTSKEVDKVAMPKRISDAARLRNSILVALVSLVHLFVQRKTATFSTKMTTPTTVRIKLVTERLENSFLCGTIVDTSSI